jgi:hypothetical protein
MNMNSMIFNRLNTNHVTPFLFSSSSSSSSSPSQQLNHPYQVEDAPSISEVR